MEANEWEWYDAGPTTEEHLDSAITELGKPEEQAADTKGTSELAKGSAKS